MIQFITENLSTLLLIALVSSASFITMFFLSQKLS